MHVGDMTNQLDSRASLLVLGVPLVVMHVLSRCSLSLLWAYGILAVLHP